MRDHPGRWTAFAAVIGLAVGVISRVLLTRRGRPQYILLDANC